MDGGAVGGVGGETVGAVVVVREEEEEEEEEEWRGGGGAVGKEGRKGTSATDEVESTSTGGEVEEAWDAGGRGEGGWYAETWERDWWIRSPETPRRCL
jgi:hypothetical protein